VLAAVQAEPVQVVQVVQVQAAAMDLRRKVAKRDRCTEAR